MAEGGLPHAPAMGRQSASMVKELNRSARPQCGQSRSRPREAAATADQVLQSGQPNRNDRKSRPNPPKRDLCCQAVTTGGPTGASSRLIKTTWPALSPITSERPCPLHRADLPVDGRPARQLHPAALTVAGRSRLPTTASRPSRMRCSAMAGPPIQAVCPAVIWVRLTTLGAGRDHRRADPRNRPRLGWGTVVGAADSATGGWVPVARHGRKRPA